MKYRVSRSSDYKGEERPCTKAYQDGSKDMWGNLLWWVDITSVDDLKALMEETGEPIILADGNYGQEIEIYDSYRE